MRTLLRISNALFLCLLCLPFAEAAGRKKPNPPAGDSPFDGKRTLLLAPIPEVKIELPDGAAYALGEDFRVRLIHFLTQSGRYTVIDEQALAGANPNVERVPNGVDALFVEPPAFQWPAGATPSARVQIAIDGMTFQTGSRGSRMVYGFNDRLPNIPNEFYLRDPGYAASWFGSTFDPKGKWPWDSLSGLELGEGFSLDALFAYLTVRYERYRGQLGLRVDVTSSVTKHTERQWIDVRDKGYFLDVAGAYNGYSLGIRIARRDALLKATGRALSAAFSTIDTALRKLPLVGTVDETVRDGQGEWVLLGFGPEPKLPRGTRLASIDAELPFVLEVAASNSSGVIATVVDGKFASIRTGTRVQSASVAPPSPTLSGETRALANTGVGGMTESRQSISTDSGKISPPAFPPGAIPKQSRWKAMWRAIIELIFVPYRIWRYYQYDQAFEGPTGAQGLHVSALPGEPSPAKDPSELAWPQAVAKTPPGTLAVAVIDSGVDMTHSKLRFALWQNPWVDEDRSGQTDPWGFDFISGDSRPYDDHFHGTQVASAVLAAAGLPGTADNGHDIPIAIVPLKVFNPWGVTHSQAMLAAFQFVEKKRIPIVVCAWDTLAKTNTLQNAVDILSRSGGVLFTGAGDRGLDLDRFPAYPAAYARTNPRVITAALVDENDQPWKTNGKGATNFGRETVTLAVQAVNLPVAEPRQGKGRATSTGLAAAKAAGAFAKYLFNDSRNYDAMRRLAGTQLDGSPLIEITTIDDFIRSQESVEALVPIVREGRRLR